jgi:parvulin-like peptidyl-prolyl isomerase
MAEMYEEMLILSRAEQLIVTVSDAELEGAIAQTRERMGLQDEAEFRQALVASNISEDQLRDRLRKNLMVQEVMGREVQSRVKLEEEELRGIWRENPDTYRIPAAVHLNDVVVLDEGRSAAAVADTARQVRAEIVAGTPIADVAKRFAAEGKTTAEVDLGWVEQDELDPSLASAAWGLEVGGVSEPVRGRGGLHILQLVERRAESIRPFEEVKDEVEARERQKRMGSVYLEYLREVEGRSYVHMQLPPEAEGFRGLADDAPQEEAVDAAPALDDAPPAAPVAEEAAEPEVPALPEPEPSAIPAEDDPDGSPPAAAPPAAAPR